MSSNNNSGGNKALKTVGTIGKYGATGVLSIVSLILKIIGTVILVALTAALIFACIFAIYIKTNLSEGLNIELNELSLNLSSVVLAENKTTGQWEEIAVLQSDETRFWVDYDEIPENFEKAVVAVEDQRFYRHNGVDWFRTGGAFFNMFISTKDTFGGSTLTQQLIKNVTGNTDPTVQRKLKEILMALELEQDYSKEEIVEYYLNVVYFGHGCYGIGAAASYYFDKEVNELSLAEIASIVGITNNPSLYSPFVNLERNKDRQEIILRLMYEQEYITYDEYLKAKNEKLQFNMTENKSVQTTVYSYFVDAVIEDAIKAIMEERECTRKIASRLLFNSGYQIYATIDTEMQAKVDSIYQDLDQIPKPNNATKQLQSAIVITDPYTGNVLAMEGGVGEKTLSRDYNRATMAKRPPGSSIKPISVYGPALEYGYITPSTRFEDAGDVQLKGINWLPQNDNRSYSGIVDVRTALRRSINTISAQILDLLTPQASYDFLTEKLHISSLGVDRDGHTDIAYAPLCLGQLTDGIIVREMAAAYGIFVNGGIYNEPRTFTKICNNDGELIYENKPTTNIAISEKTAYWMTVMLSDAAANGTGHEAYLGFMPTAGKTGTSGDNYDRWFCGYTPYYVATVWTGYDTPSKISISGNPAAQLWKKVMTLVHEDLEYREFSKPADVSLPSVPGVLTSDCIVRCVNEQGAVIAESSSTYAVGKTVTLTAPEIESYTLTDEAVKTVEISDNMLDNIVEFKYTYNIPIVEPDPTEVTDPAGTEDPTVTPDPGQTTPPGEETPPPDNPGSGEQTENPGTTEPPPDNPPTETTEPDTPPEDTGTPPDETPPPVTSEGTE